MKRPTQFTRRFSILTLLAAAALALESGPAGAGLLYWDSNGATAGAGTTPTGTWGTDDYWSTNASGTSATGAYTDPSDAVFSAGTDATGSPTITLTSSQNADSLTFEEGAVTISGTGGIISLTGTGGNVTVNSGVTAMIGSNTTTVIGGSVGLTKLGGGTLALNGSTVNTFTGGTAVNGGTLALDLSNFTSGYADLIGSSNALAFGGGAMTLKGNADNDSSQAFNGTAVNAGGGSLLVTPNGTGRTATVSLGSLGSLIAWPAGSSLVVGGATATGTTVINTTNDKDTTTPAGIYGGRIVYTTNSGTAVDWATTATGTYTLSGLASGSYTTLPTSGGSATENYMMTAATILAGGVEVNSFKLEAPSGDLALGANTLTNASGGLLVTGTAGRNITGTVGGTRLTAGNGSGAYDLIVHQYNSGGLTISAVIGNNGGNATSLTKAGTGPLTLSGANTYSGNTYINAGTLYVGDAAALGTTAGTTTVAAGATLNVSGRSGVTIAETIYLNGTGNSGVGALYVTPVNGAWANRTTISGQVKLQSDSTITVDSGGGANAYLDLTGGVSPAVAGTTTLTINSLSTRANGSQSQELPGVLSDGSGRLQVVITGTGRVDMDGGNTYTGPTTINSSNGDIVGRGTSFGTGPLAILNFGNSAAATTCRVDLNSVTVAGLNTNPGTTVTSIIYINSGQTLTIGHTANSVPCAYSGTITSAGALTKIGPGTQTLSGTLNYSGGTTNTAGTLILSGAGIAFTGGVSISGGTLQLDNGAGLNSQAVAFGAATAGTLTLNGNSVTIANLTGSATGPIVQNASATAATLTVGTASNLSGTYAGVLQDGTGGGALSLIKAGTGTLILSGVNTYTGPTTINANAGTLSITGPLGGGNYAGSTAIGAGSTLSFNATQTMSSEISGAGGLTVAGGTLTLAATNTYTGVTSVNGGTLRVDSPNSLHADSAVTVASGATLAGSGTINGPVSVSANGRLAPGSASALGPLSLGQTLTLNGGTLVNCRLPNSGTTGDLAAITGNLVLNGKNYIALSFPDGAVPAGTYTLMTYAAQMGAGTLELLGSYPNASFTVGATSVTLTVGEGGTSAYTWTGASSYVWDTSTSNWLATGTATPPVSYAEGSAVTFDDTGSNGAPTAIIGTVNPGAVTFDNSSKNYILSAAIGSTNGASLLKLGSGNLTLSGANSYTGPTTIGAGTLTLGAAGVIPDGSAVSMLGASTLAMQTYNETVASLTTSGSGAIGLTGTGMLTATNGYNFTSMSTVAVAPKLSGSATLTVNGNSNTVVTLSGNSSTTYTGNITLSNGTLKAGNAGALGMAAGSTTVSGAGAALDLNGIAVALLEPVTLNGTGISNAGALLNSSVAAASLAGAVALQSASSIGVSAAGGLTIGGVVSGGFELTKVGTGTLTLTGTNTYTGSTTISGGTLSISGGGTLGSGDYAGNTVIGSGAILSINATQTMSGPISGAGNLTVAGGSLTLSSAANSYTGGTTLNAGTLVCGANNVLSGPVSGTLTSLDLEGSAALNMNGFDQTLNSPGGTAIFFNSSQPLNTGSATLTIASGFLAFYSGASEASPNLIAGKLDVGGETLNVGTRVAGVHGEISAVISNGGVATSGTRPGGGSFNGNGNLYLTGTNTYSGTTTHAVGGLYLGKGGTTGSLNPAGSINLSVAGKNFYFYRSDTITQGVDFPGISGPGSVVQQGKGTTVLTGSNTYSGTTTISAGTLKVNGQLSGAGGAVTVLAGGALAGTGTIARSVIVTNGATLSPGDLTGTLTVNSNLTVSAAATNAFALGTNSALVAVNGKLVLGGTLNVTDAGGFGPGTYTLFTYTGGLTYSGVVTGSVPPALTYAIDTNTAGQVKLVVSGEGGLAASFTAAPTNGYVPLAVTFTDTSTGTITNRHWDFGNGTLDTAATLVTNTYAGVGAYTVQLTVSGPDGYSTVTHSNLVSVRQVPQPAFVDGSEFSVNPSGQATFHILTTNGVKYRITYSGDLLSNGWAAVTPPLPDGWTNGGDAPVTLQDTNTAGVAQRFYRIESKSVDAP